MYDTKMKCEQSATYYDSLTSCWGFFCGVFSHLLQEAVSLLRGGIWDNRNRQQLSWHISVCTCMACWRRTQRGQFDRIEKRNTGAVSCMQESLCWSRMFSHWQDTYALRNKIMTWIAEHDKFTKSWWPKPMRKCNGWDIIFSYFL